MKTTTILLAGRRAEQLDAIEAHLDGAGWRIERKPMVNGHADPLQGMEKLPDILVFAVTPEWRHELEALSARPADRRPPLLVVGETDDLETMRAAMRAGARDFVPMPLTGDGLRLSAEAIARDQIPTTVVSERVIALVNAKGGAGASSVAVNLALAAASHGQRVALLDMNLQSGALPVYLDLDSTGGGLADALTRAGELDAVAIEGFMLRHSSGVHVLAADPSRMYTADAFREESMLALLEVLAAAYDLVVIDVPTAHDRLSANALLGADRVTVVLQQTVVQLREAKRLIDVLTGMAGLDPSRLHVVINRWSRKDAISERDIRRALGEIAISEIPNDYRRMLASEDAGTPVVLADPGSPVAKAFIAMARDLGAVPSSEQRGGLLSGLLSWRRA